MRPVAIHQRAKGDQFGAPTLFFQDEPLRREVVDPNVFAAHAGEQVAT